MEASARAFGKGISGLGVSKMQSRMGRHRLYLSEHIRLTSLSPLAQIEVSIEGEHGKMIYYSRDF